MGVVRVRVLGPFQVSVDDDQIDLPQKQLRILLAVLAMTPGKAVSVERLVQAVWEEDLPANARRTIQTYVTRLRSMVGSDAITTESGGGYALRTGAENVDAELFGRLVDRAAGEPDLERVLLGEALALWRGRPFDDVDSAWLHEHERPRLEERRLTALERRVDLDLAAGRVQGLAAELRDIAAAYPLRETLWSRLLRALAKAGRQAEALALYEKVRLRIADELGVDPGAELQRVHADLLAGTVTLPAEDERAESRVRPRQLPADLARFTGRGDLLARLDEQLDRWQAQPSVAIIAVDGPGGAGKTSLVVHWAHRVDRHFTDGQLYVNLRGYGPGEPMSPAAALDALLLGLGVSASRIPSDIDARANLLRSELAERRMLVLLDNARDADQVRPLLPGSGESLVVVTSRRQLRGLVAREGAHRVSVSTLAPSDSAALLTAVVGTGGGPDEAALAELAERCGHLPLALAIAAERASRHDDVGLDGLLAELREEQERLDTLDIGEESASLRAVFASSYRALDPEAAAAFRRLGLHVDSDISLPAAAALAGSPLARVRRLLDRLVDNNLVQQRRSGRYELHDLLRSYAAELAGKDAGDERQAALDRLLDWYMSSAMNAWKVMWPNHPDRVAQPPMEGVSPAAFDSREQALAWLETERTALTAVIRVAADRGQHTITRGLSNVLWLYLYRRRALDDLFDVLRVMADSSERNDDRTGLATATLRQGVVLAQQAEYEPAMTSYERARELYELAGEDVGQGRALSNLCTLHTEMGRLEEAADYGERALGWLAAAPREQGPGFNNLAIVYLRLGRYEDGYEAARRAIEVSRGLALEVETASALDTLGQALLGLGRADEAVQHIVEARRLLAEVGARWEEGAVLVNLARALSQTGDPDGARAAATEALAIIDELGAPDTSEFNRADVHQLLSGLPAAQPVADG